MQADEKLWYPRVDEIQTNNKKKKKKFPKSYKLILQAKEANSVLRWQVQMHTGYANSL